MVNRKQIAGKTGEDAAASFLRKKGFQIIDRNFRIRNGEIDIVAIDTTDGKGKEVLVFIEVKTRSSSDFGTPFESITFWKLKSLIRTSEFYKISHAKLPDAMRIDAIGVTLSDDNEVLDIEHMKNIGY